MTLHINLFGEAGSGKSTLASELFSVLKKMHYNCELVTEFAKYLTWEKNSVALGHQFYVTAKQMHREYVVDGKVDVLITDSPPILGLLYYQEDNHMIRNSFEDFITLSFKRNNNLSYLLTRTHPYIAEGRNQSEVEAYIIRNKLIDLLKRKNIEYKDILGDEAVVPSIISDIKNHLQK
jgi:tRNA uridine 5-carbamoylmethylation protein Kti12